MGDFEDLILEEDAFDRRVLSEKLAFLSKVDVGVSSYLLGKEFRFEKARGESYWVEVDTKRVVSNGDIAKEVLAYARCPWKPCSLSHYVNEYEHVGDMAHKDTWSWAIISWLKEPQSIVQDWQTYERAKKTARYLIWTMEHRYNHWFEANQISGVVEWLKGFLCALEKTSPQQKPNCLEVEHNYSP